MDPVLDRIDDWERAGLIDGSTAARLRAAEAGRADAAPSPDLAGERTPIDPVLPQSRAGHLSVSAVFGPGVTIGEMFGYLGGGFILGAWSAFAVRLAGSNVDTSMIGAGALIAAVGLVVVGLALGTADPRRRRAAGVALLVAVPYVSIAAAAFLGRSRLDPYLLAIVVTAVTVGAATLTRLLLPALLTTLGLVGSITGFGWAVLAYALTLVTPRFDVGFPSQPPQNEVPVVIVSAVGWLLVALVLGFFAIAEDRAAPEPADDPDGHDAARRRSTLIRAWAGLVAVWGLASAVSRSGYGFDFGRVIPAWIGDAAILVLALILVERAFRRDSGAFLFAAGIGFITALTDFNFTYLGESRDLGLLIEGGILLAVGFAADRLRRRMPGGRSMPPPSVVEPVANTAS
ncbi:MAG TPA: hypothetical protein VHM48_09695 [Candidatus Limnocylindrales bacterium]|nr:hypothetical protein [Candidatus Limnocylindrales bacterium]